MPWNLTNNTVSMDNDLLADTVTFFDVAPLILFFGLDFLDKYGAHDTDSGIVGNLSSWYFELPFVSAVQTLCFSSKLYFGNITGGCDIKGCYATVTDLRTLPTLLWPTVFAPYYDVLFFAGAEVLGVRSQGQGQNIPAAGWHAVRQGPQLSFLWPAHERAMVQGVLGSSTHNTKVIVFVCGEGIIFMWTTDILDRQPCHGQLDCIALKVT